MNSWKDFILDDIGKWGSGGTPLSSVPEYYGGNIPWLIIEDLNDGVVESYSRTITEAGLKNSAAKLLPKGTLLIAMYGSIGKLGITSFECATNQAIAFCQLYPDLARTDFVYYYLLFRRNDLINLGTGVTQQNISQEKIRPFPIPLPPLAEQQPIAAILQKADRVRRLRRYARSMSESVLQGVFLEMFGDLIENKERRVFLSDLGEVQGGLQLSSKRRNLELTKPYLRVANVYRERLDLSEIKNIELTKSEFHRTKLQTGDVLFVEGHGNIDEIGRCAVWDGSVEACVHQNHLIRFRVKGETVLPEYVSFYSNYSEGRKYFRLASNTTSGLNTISTSIVNDMPIVVPPFDAQAKFLMVKNKYSSSVKAQRESERQAEHLFQSLLKRAFEGAL